MNRVTRRAAIAAALVIAVLLVAVMRRSPDSELKQLAISGVAIGTTYEVKVVSTGFGEEAEEALARGIKTEIDHVDKLMSRFRDDSEISGFNRHRSVEPFDMSDDAISLLKKAHKISELTDGAFDTTVGPLVRLWGFHTKKSLQCEPDPAAIEREKARVGYRLLDIDAKRDRFSKKRVDVELDLSGVAKGHAVDMVAIAVMKLGYENFMVEIGGEVRVGGISKRGTPWRVAIEKPINATQREIYEVIELKDTSMATSGDYRSFYKIDGKRISHTIDPRTGRPIENRLASVTVLHDECSVADSLATGLTVMGPDDGLKLANRQNLTALFIVREDDDRLVDLATPSFRRLLSESRANISGTDSPLPR